MMGLWINVALAVIWLMLSEQPGIGDFIAGFLLGFLLIVPLAKLIGGEDYVRRCKNFAKFLFLFLSEFVKSNFSVAHVVLFVPKHTLKPGYLFLDVGDMSTIEAIFLSYCVTLTPGTISVRLKSETGRLVIHCLNAQKMQETIRDFETKFKKSILSFTR